MTHSPVDLSIPETGALLRSGDLTVLDLVRAHLERIAFRNPDIGAFVYVAEVCALEAARAADAAFSEGIDLSPLQGIPFAIKDIFDVAGWPVRWGSRAYETRTAQATATAVQSLIDAGAIPLGLVATYELATVGPDKTSLYAQPRNPWNRAHVTGGSSSGSAAAVAAGMVRFALGTDTGGSVRSPSAYCGVIGLKPTHGLISLDGAMPLAPSMDHVGPIAKTVVDTEVVLSSLTHRPAPREIKGLRIGFARNWCTGDGAHPALITLMDNAASTLSLMGARVTLATLPDYEYIERMATQIILAEEFASHGKALKSAPEQFGAMATQSIMSGARIAPAALAEAHQVGREFGAELDALLSSYDVLLLPTTLTPAPPFSDFDDGKAVWTAMRTIPFNVTGHPALSLPMGFADGLPLGLQLVGQRNDEGTLLRLGAAFEAATDHGALHPD